MAGNDKPNLSDLKARLSFRLGEQSAVQAPAPSAQAQQRQTASQPSTQSQSPDPARAQSPQYQTGGFTQAAQPAQQSQQYAQQQAYAQQQVQQQQQAYVAQQQAQQQQAAAQAQQAQEAARQAQQPLRQASQQAPYAQQPQSRPAASGQQGKQQKGGLKDLQASFDREESFKPLAHDDVQFKGNPVITVGGVIIAIAALVIGCVATYMYTTGSQKRQLFSFQIKDANEAFETLQPKVNAFDQLQAFVATLDPKKVDFSATEKLGTFAYVVDGSPFNSSRVMLGGKIISPIIHYMTDSTLIKSMIDQHIRLTMADKDELLKLTGDGSVANFDTFGVVFNAREMIDHASDKNFVSKPGSFAAVENFKPGEEELRVKILSTGEVRNVKARFFVPLTKSSVISVQGLGNALDRYTRRLDAIKRRVAAVDFTRSMMDNLSAIAQEPEPGLFSFGGGDSGSSKAAGEGS